MRTGNGRTDISDVGFMIAVSAMGRQGIQRSTLDRWAIERLLRRAMCADRGSASLRRLLGRTHFRPINIHRMTDEDVLRTLARLVSVGEIHVAPTRWLSRESSAAETAAGGTRTAATGGKPIKSSSEDGVDRRDRPMHPDRDPADRSFPPASPQPDPKNWIEFHLVDHETEEPIANVPFRLTLSDGSVAEHTSDGNGMIRIDDLPPGYCDIQEILDKGAFEVVRLA